MAERVSEYILVFGPAQTVVKQVNERLEQGFEPLGPPFLMTPNYAYGVNICQAMVKKVHDERSPR
jgi:hypothetical protein